MRPSLRPHRRPARPALEPIEPRRLFTATLPTTTTTLTLASAVTAANQPITLTAAVSASDASTPTGTVAFLEITDASHDPRYYTDGPDLVSFTDPDTQATDTATFLGTATLGPGGTATLSLPTFPSSRAFFTGQFRAVFLGSALPIALYDDATVVNPTLNEPFGPTLDPTDPLAAYRTTSYLVFPHDQALAFSGTRITAIADIPDDFPWYYTRDPASHQYFSGSQDGFLTPTATPLLVSTSSYGTNVYPAPAFAHIQDLNPSLLPSISPIGTAPRPSATSLHLQTSGINSFTNPSAVYVSIYDPATNHRLSGADPARIDRGEVHSAQAGLLVNTGGGDSYGGEVNIDGGGPPPPPFVPPGPIPTGTVSFFDEHNALLATVPLDADGNAAFAPEPRSLPLGTHRFHITYSGDANFPASQTDSDPFNITLTPTVLDVPGVDFRLNSPSDLIATVSTADRDFVTPTGTVTFTIGYGLTTTVRLGDTVPLDSLINPYGDHPISLSYSGDANCLPCTLTGTLRFVSLGSGRGYTTLINVTRTGTPAPPADTTPHITDLFPQVPTILTPNVQLGSPIRFTAPPDATGDNLLSAHYTVRVAAFLSADDIAGNADDIPLGTLSGSNTPAGPDYLLSGLDHRLLFPDTAFAFAAAPPAGTPAGTYHLVITVDPDNAIPEADEDNNALVSTETVTIANPTSPAPATPDLTGRLLPARPTSTPGTPASLTLSLTNPSFKPVTRKYTINYYLSADRTFSPADDTRFSRQSITTTLAGRQTRSIPLTYTLPKSTPLGTRYLIAVADTPAPTPKAHLEIASPTPLNIVGPHLTASIRSVTPAGRPDTARVTVRVLNDGSAPFAGPATLRLLSDTPTVDTVLLTAKKSITLKTNKYVDYTFTVRRPVGSTLSATLA